MKVRLLIATGLGVATAAVLTPTPAVAYDPCQRAQQDVERAEAAVRRWYAENCPRSGKCWGSPAELFALGDRVQNARERRSRACV